MTLKVVLFLEISIKIVYIYVKIGHNVIKMNPYQIWHPFPMLLPTVGNDELTILTVNGPFPSIFLQYMINSHDLFLI